MFTKSAAFYDAVYAAKDYAGEAERIDALIKTRVRTRGKTLLDVGCGTGGHLAYLKHYYVSEGLDLDPHLLAIARERHPELPFHHTDMVQFDLGHTFDAVVCLFSAIGYVVTVERLHSAIAAMARHLRPGGVLLVEPWLPPDGYTTGTVHALYVDQPQLKIARINVAAARDRVSLLDFHIWWVRRRVSSISPNATSWVCSPKTSTAMLPSPPGSKRHSTNTVSLAAGC